MSDSNNLANGHPLTQSTFNDFVERLKHDCAGAGVRDHCTADAIFLVEKHARVYGIDRISSGRQAFC